MILIIGATGTVGRATIDVLAAQGRKVTAITRSPQSARLPETVTVLQGDPAVPNIPEQAWDGVEAVLLSPRAVAGAAAPLLAQAARHGVRHVVVISSSTVPHPAGEPRFAAHFAAVEAAATASGLDWTFLRCADFAANSLAWAPQILATGTVRGAYAAATTSPIHERDIAEVAALALTHPEHAGRAYVLTGPHPLDQTEKVRLLGEVLGRDLSFIEVAPDHLRAAMLGQGLPEEVPARLLGSLADYAHHPGPTTETVRDLLGRPALDYAQWARDNAAAFKA
ncbi:NAD(P)H-binding protein [Kitasatospora viridis]|uniref:Uncharacterized protein YbjT (DUF2867 family) n=1 Tax=Kitasatospora viridis TaxID=281105 RepID=A0A561TSD5_9ACTN|nr:NAD(P)H-binding protein [Kitasatospora viridis]TWF90025.1 uncharacterized protein YbjT (DUF2867 family) [Kitasatospora viridis]